MLSSLKKLIFVFDKKQKVRLIKLQFLIILMAFSELAGVVSIAPFMAVVADLKQLEGDGFFGDLFRFSQLSTPREFLFYLGLFVFFILSIATCISIYTTKKLSVYGNQLGAEIGSVLYEYYMHQPWIYHSTVNSSVLINKVAQESSRVTSTIIIPALQMNGKVVMAFFMFSTIFIYNPVVAIIGVAIFLLSYFLLYKLVRDKLVYNDKQISIAYHQRFKLLNEGLGGIKDVLLLGRQAVYIDRFNKASVNFANAQASTQMLSLTPRYIMELVAFGTVIFLILYLIISHNGNLGVILPVLSVYALAGFKLLPALQQIYVTISCIRGNLGALNAIVDDLYASKEKVNIYESAVKNKISPKKSIKFENISFTYPGKQKPALNNVNIEFPLNKIIGLVGPSGSGKSTAIDMLLALIEPQKGKLLIDGVPLDYSEKRRWQNSLGFVPQSIFLADSSIRENIAFGLPVELIDEDKVTRAIGMSRLSELISELPEGLSTRVGERGVQLSGGQRQRIGIARALYHDAEVLILDEATSALDGITEKLIMDAIHDFSGKKTIIMIAHRLTTVKECDCIYIFDEGKVVDVGVFSELYQRNNMFKQMSDSV